MEECWKKAAGKAKIAQPPRASDPEHKGKGKGGKGKRRASSLDDWPDDQGTQTPGEKSKNDAEVAGLFIGTVSRRGKYFRQDWLAWERIQEQAQHQWKSYKSGNPSANAVDAEMGERIDLTIDPGCAACAFPVGVASAIRMQELDRTPQEHIAANSEKIRELNLKTPTLKFQNGDVQSLKFSVMDKLHKPLVAACKVVAAGNRIVLQLEKQGGSFIEDVRSKRRNRIFERNGVYVLQWS